MGCNAWNHSANCDCGWGGDTGGGEAQSGGIATLPVLPQKMLGQWGKYEAGRLESYTIPNARCPVCGASVFFYQSEWGGRVFFNDLGPPWDKHGCTDNWEPTGNRKAPSPLDRANTALLEKRGQSRLRHMQESGWHPLLDVKISHVAERQLIVGRDPIDNRWYKIMSKAEQVSHFMANCPTFIRISKPAAVECKVQQVQLSESGEVLRLDAGFWNGARSRSDAASIVEALNGNVESARKIAFSRSFSALSSFRERKFINLESAAYWFEIAIELGSIEAAFEAAYLRDILAISEDQLFGFMYRNADIEDVVGIILGRGAVVEDFVGCSSAMDRGVYAQRLRNMERHLLQLSGRGETTNLRAAIVNFLASNPSPLAVNRHAKGTPDRRRRGTPLSDMMMAC